MGNSSGTRISPLRNVNSVVGISGTRLHQCLTEAVSITRSFAQLLSLKSVCLCGNNLNNGEVLPTSLCSTPCSDRSSNYTCGGGGSGELYETSVVAAQVAAFNAKRSPGWQGA